MGDTVLSFGKHRGRTFADLKANEPGYVSWALKQAAPKGGLALREQQQQQLPTALSKKRKQTREDGWNAERVNSARYGPYGTEIVLNVDRMPWEHPESYPLHLGNEPGWHCFPRHNEQGGH